MIKIKHNFTVDCDSIDEVEYAKQQCRDLGYKITPTSDPKRFKAEMYEERTCPPAPVKETETPVIKEI